MRRIAFAVAGVLAVALVAAQLVLPRLAERSIRSELRRGGGDVASVHVSAFPALELLWHHADAVRVRLRSARYNGAGDFATELERARHVGRLDATVATLALGPLRLRDIELRKRGGALTGAATVTRRDLSAALPVDVGLEPVAASGGALVLQASVGPLTARARLSASGGALRIAPDGLLGGFASVTVFDDPRVAIMGVGARRRPDGFVLTARGRLA